MGFENALGAQAPLGFWDPLGLLKDADQARFDRLRYVEVKHGRIGMLAILGHLVTKQASASEEKSPMVFHLLPSKTDLLPMTPSKLLILLPSLVLSSLASTPVRMKSRMPSLVPKDGMLRSSRRRMTLKWVSLP
eukprot:gene4182-biopygen1994